MDGSPLRDHLHSIWRTTGKKPEALDNELDPDLAYLWGWFVELNQCRSAGFDGPGALSYSEIAAWANLTGRRPEPWEVSAIMACDAEARVKRDAEA